MPESLLPPHSLALLNSCETSALSKNTHALDDNVDPSCCAVSDGLQRIDEMNLDWFVKCILPSPVDEFTVNRIRDDFWRDWIVAYKEESGTQNENGLVVFSQLERIFVGIVNTVKQICMTCMQITELTWLSNRPPHSVCADLKLPDAVLELVNKDPSDQQSYWRNIVAGIATKDDDEGESFEKNFVKIMSNFHQIFRNDHCRRFVIGVTIENTTTRLWWACRTKVIVTEPFDFVETPKPLIQTFAALGFSARTELGYDWECEKIMHIPRNLVDFENGKFLIKNGLSKRGAYCLRKHVFKTITSKRSERAKLNECRKHRHFSPRSHRRSTIINNERKRLGESTPYSVWLSPVSDIFSNDRSSSNAGIQADISDAETNVKGVETEIEVDVPSPPRSVIVPSIALAKRVRAFTREHYRIILRQTECRASHTAKLADIIQILQTAVEVLKFAHTADWVSSDIGFVVVYGRGSITDRYSRMAFARKLDSITHEEFVTGMLDFMSIEVQQLKYGFRPEETPNPSSAPKVVEESTEEVWNPIKNKKIAFRYNPIHDFESIWWIAAWSFFRRKFDPPPDGYGGDNERRDYGDIIFPGETFLDERYKAFTSEERFRLICATLPSGLQQAGVVLDELRKALIGAYTLAERNLPEDASSGSIDLTVCDELWKTFMNGFEKMRRLTEGVTLVVRRHGIGQWREFLYQ